MNDKITKDIVAMIASGLRHASLDLHGTPEEAIDDCATITMKVLGRFLNPSTMERAVVLAKSKTPLSAA